MEPSGGYLSSLARTSFHPTEQMGWQNESWPISSGDRHGASLQQNFTWNFPNVDNSWPTFINETDYNVTTWWSTNLTRSTNSTNTTNAPAESQQWGTLALSILILCTALGNMLVILAVCWERRLQNMTNYFLLSLAIADFLVSLLVMPLGMIVSLYNDNFLFDPHLCVAWFTCDVLMCTASIWHMCTMSMDRFLTLRYPMRYGRNKTKSTVVIKILCVWLISVLITSPITIMGFMDTNNVYNSTTKVCAPQVSNYVIYASIFAFFVPLAIMVVTYILTIRILNNNRKLAQAMGRHRKFSKGSLVTNGHSNSMSETTCAQLNRSRRGSTNLPLDGNPVETEEKSREVNIRPTSLSDSVEQELARPLVKSEPNSTVSQGSVNSLSTSKSDRTFHDSDDSIDMKQISLSVNNLRETDILLAFARVKSCPVLYSDDENELIQLKQDITLEEKNNAQLVNDKEAVASTSNNLKHDNAFGNHHEHQTASTFSEQVALPKNNSEKDLLEWLEMPKMERVHSMIAEDMSESYQESQDFVPTCIDDFKKEINDNLKEIRDQNAERTNGHAIGIKMNRLDMAAENRWHMPEVSIPVVKVSYHKDGVTTRMHKTQCKQYRTSICTMQPVQYEFNKNYLQLPEPSQSNFICKLNRQNDLKKPSLWNGLETYTEKNGIKHMDSPRTMSLMRRVRRVRATTRRLLLTRAHQSNEQKASKVLGIIFAVFVILWTPFFIVNLLGGFCEECMNNISPDVLTLLLWLGYVASLANPIIYTCFNTSFRRAFLRILKCYYFKHQTPSYHSSSYVDRFPEKR